jgi:hypothetical protein
LGNIAFVISNPDRFQRAIEAIDAANEQDPRREEIPYSQAMTQWLLRLYPDASEALQLAARAQHVQRWVIPRNQYPMDRAGYHRWRTNLMEFHAEKASEILRGAGYDDATIARVKSLIRKERLKADAETQALEDAICMVFLEREFTDFSQKHPEEKVINIVRRTWGKMSARGHEAAIALVPSMDAQAQSIVKKAL